MNVPEGLRNISFASYPLTVGSWEGPVRAVRLDHLESWFASHELVDLTVCGPQCPAWRVMVGAPRCIATFRTLTVEEDPDYDARIDNAPIGQPCSVMVARKGTT